MISVRNVVLFAICVILTANLLLHRPAASRVPHARRSGFDNRSARSVTHGAATDETSSVGDAAMGQVVYASNCTSCHGSRGHGLPRQGVNLRTSQFIAGQSDDQLAAFLREGRRAGDPGSVMGLMMPARGGNRALDDVALRDLVAFLRAAQDEERREALPATEEAAETTVPSRAN